MNFHQVGLVKVTVTIYINVCHDSKRIYFNDSIPECEKKDVLPRVLNTFLGMYPRYVLHSGE
jgi:hypothetical protein